MNRLKSVLFAENKTIQNWGLFFLRIIAGYFLFYHHGLSKISNPEKWDKLGQLAMSTFGIDFAHVYFGFLASFSEGICSLLVLAGLFTRPASMMIMLTMLFAVSYHLGRVENPESAFIYMGIYLALMLTGPGKFSLDRILFYRK